MSTTRGSSEQAIDANALVLEIVRELSPSGVTDVEPDAELVADLGFESLGLVELLAALEDTFHLEPIDLEELGKLDRVSDLQRIIEEAQTRMQAAGGSE